MQIVYSTYLMYGGPAAAAVSSFLHFYMKKPPQTGGVEPRQPTAAACAATRVHTRPCGWLRMGLGLYM